MGKKNLISHHYNIPLGKVGKLNALQKKRLILWLLPKITLVASFFLVFLFFAFIYRMLFYPRIWLDGGSVVLLSYQEKYQEKGYVSSYQGTDLTSKVVVRGKVNENKLGEYPITYSVSYRGKKVSKKRIVRVIDNKKPRITFTTGAESLYLCPNTKYLYDDYQAVDNYDGNITDKVKVKETGGVMQYQVKDSFGNVQTAERKVIYQDIEGPQLVLDSPSFVSLSLGDEFVDSTYQVQDNCSSSVKVKVSGDVDTSTPGEYRRIYQAKDDASNVTKVVQKVIVMEKAKPGVIYLTFDDGPKLGTTEVILDVLKEKGVKATFFVTNGGPDELIKRAYDEGHAIGLHTASHDYSIVYSSIDAYFDDLNLVGERVERITGKKSRIIRFPGGSSNTISKRYTPGIMSYLTKEVLNQGYHYYDWNIDSRDAEGKKYTADELAKFVISHLSCDKVNMVLMHDIKSTTKDAVGKIIDYGLSNGYTFEAIGPYTDMVLQRVNN